MSASTPPLVDVIAEAIADHEQELDQTACPTGYCVCNEKFASSEDHAAHQARAVLDALTKAGDVEWAVVLDGDTYMFASHGLDIAKKFLRIHGGQLSERTKAGPWTAVEG